LKKTFAIVGVAGYIAPKHLEAIKKLGGEVKYAYDIADSVGVLDNYFRDCIFTTKERVFKKHLRNSNVDYLVICTPNYLHYRFIKLGLKYCKNVICEKPLVIKYDHLWKLHKHSQRINCIMQLRLSPVVKQIKKVIELDSKVKFNYFVDRGQWYDVSWKADKRKSGGLLYNIGIHVLDLMMYMGVDLKKCVYNIGVSKVMDKFLNVDGELFDLSVGFKDLHIRSYQEILKGNGFHIEDLFPVMNFLRKEA
jgi:UDP-N-acetyl-2-amino-2-deoxyglucuronate dehydrogenase